MKSFILFQDFFASRKVLSPTAKGPWERKQSKGTGSAEQVSLESSWGFFGIFAFEAKMLHAHENLHNAPPIKRVALFRAGLFVL